MSLINITGLTFAYDGSFGNIFENVSFQIDTDWKLGLIGRNGRGKTTLLRLLLGGLEYRGSITASVSFDYFPCEIPDMTQTTASIIDSLNPDLQAWELERELSLLEVASDVLDRPFNTLSGGEQTKVMLAVMFTRENSFLLIDEPTNHLDLAARSLVGRYLQGKKGFILVSHDRDLLDNCVDHVMSINKQDIQIQRGNFSAWWENKQRQDAFELSRNIQLKREISQLKAAAKQTADRADEFERAKIGAASADIGKSIGKRPYMGEKSRKMMKQSKNIERRQLQAADEKSTLLKNLEMSFNLKISPLSHHARVLVNLEGVTITYGAKTVCRDVSLHVERGDRVALRGRNGSGKSSLLRLICGEPVERTGKVQLASGLVVSYVPQDSSFLSGSLTDYARICAIDESLFKAILNKLDFTRLQFDKRMEDFSEGQKKKVLIARSLCEQAHLYVWDEPLNYIDLFSRMQIEDLLLTFQPTILFVEHDRVFADKISTKTVELP